MYIIFSQCYPEQEDNDNAPIYHFTANKSRKTNNTS